MKGYSLIHARPGTSGSVLLAMEKLKRTTPTIKSADYVYGTFDVVVVIEAETEEEFVRALSAIGTVDNVTATNTLVVATRDLAVKYALSS